MYKKKLNLCDNLTTLTDYEVGATFKVHVFKRCPNVERGNFLFYDEETDLNLYANLQLSSC